eukprot:COSAG01_NODE_4397_length_5067_cov_2.350443_3_plen_80_part_00
MPTSTPCVCALHSHRYREERVLELRQGPPLQDGETEPWVRKAEARAVGVVGQPLEHAEEQLLRYHREPVDRARQRSKGR